MNRFTLRLVWAVVKAVEWLLPVVRLLCKMVFFVFIVFLVLFAFVIVL